MKSYELTYLISPEVPEKDFERIQEEMESFLKQEGAILKKIEKPAKKNLAYQIDKKNSAFLVNLDFHLEPGKLKDFEKKLEEEKRILRFIILSKKRLKKIPEVAVKIPEKVKKFEKKVELKEIEKKLEEILGE